MIGLTMMYRQKAAWGSARPEAKTSHPRQPMSLLERLPWGPKQRLIIPAAACVLRAAEKG